MIQKSVFAVLLFFTIASNCTIKTEFFTPTFNNQKKEIIASTINVLKNTQLDSTVIYSLERESISTYKRSLTGKKLNNAEIKKLMSYLSNKNNFYGGTPMSFGFTSEIVFYAKGKENSIKIAPDSYKVFQEDFDIPHNRMKTIKELGGATYFPFIKEDFINFLKVLETRYL